jgi:hypothetical protein
MYKVIKRERFGPVTFLWEVVAPEVADRVSRDTLLWCESMKPGSGSP